MSSPVPANGLSPDVDVETHRRRLRQGVYPRRMAPVIEHFLDENERLRDDLTHTIAFLEGTKIPGCRAVATQLRQQLSLGGGGGPVGD